MKQYQVLIEEILSRVVEVEAQDKDEVLSIVVEKYGNSEIILEADDFQEVAIRNIEEE